MPPIDKGIIHGSRKCCGLDYRLVREIIATEWKEFTNIDLEAVKSKMATPMVFDGRNLFDPKTMKDLGFTYKSIGRPAVD